MRDLEEIIRLVELAQRYDLETGPYFYDLNFAEMIEIYNGCGPEWLPEAIRRLMTRFYALFEPAFLIHDIDFNFSDKTQKGFNVANRRMLRNCRKIVAKSFSWWLHPLTKARWYFRANYVFEAVERFGWSAWLQN